MMKRQSMLEKGDGMAWIEEIKLRAAINKKGDARHYLEKAARKMDTVKGLAKAEILTHAFLVNDFSLQLVWDTEKPEAPGSEEGLKLRTVLKQFGLVSHDVWIKEK